MKRLLKWLFTFAFVIAVILFSIVGTIDRTPLIEQDFYKEMMDRLDTVSLPVHKPSQKLKAGWGKISITPDHSMPLAGYRMREQFESVHDSLYARIIGINNGSISCYLISVDLLLFPPAIKQNLEKKISKEFTNRPFLYFSATHTHNGIGGWNNSLVGNLVLGDYEDAWVAKTTENLISEIKRIEKSMQPAQLSYWEVDAKEYAENRLLHGAPHDGVLRGIKFGTADSTSAQLITYSAHATSISKLSKALSGDYPNALISQLRKNDNSFGIFMAGMVGSHRLAGLSETEFELVAKAGEVLTQKISDAKYDPAAGSVQITAAHIPIQFGPSQLRITKNWKLRNWVFSSALNPIQGELTYLQLGNIVMIGTPCDFSGELFVTHKLNELAMSQNKHLIITSFNGDYTGYITEDSHYEQLEKEEVMSMNWVGPYYGNYFSEMISTLLKK
jgi:neutral ceramidase